MVTFQGDLLLGGMALRNLVGFMQTDAAAGSSAWSGYFQMNPQQKSILETGRPYLLLLDDGRSGQVVVTDWEATETQNALQVRFQTAD